MQRHTNAKWLERSCLVRVASFDLQRDFIVERHARVKRDSKRATREPLTSSNGRRVSAGRYEGVIVFTLLIRVAFNGPWSFAIVICPRPPFLHQSKSTVSTVFPLPLIS